MKSYPNTENTETGIETKLRLVQDEDLLQMSAADIAELIQRLQSAHALACAREAMQQDRRQKEQRKKEEEDRQRAEQDAHVRSVTSMDLPLDWENAFNSDARTQGVHFDSIPDALVHCLCSLGRVDIEYIASVTGADYKTVILTLKGSIYQNPESWQERFYLGWETADEYLSGNLKRKWKVAFAANEKYNGYFADNLRAIERVLPPAVAAKDIYITLGSPWVPPDVIDDFLVHLFGSLNPRHLGYSDEQKFREYMGTVHDEASGSWRIPEKNRYGNRVSVVKTYGTDKMNALHILERTLNMKPVSVTREVSSLIREDGKRRVIDQTETAAVLEKQQKLIGAFRKWVWSDPERKQRLEEIFEEKFGCVRSRNFDGSFLQFPSMSPSAQLYPYQKDAVARIIFTPNTLLAHDVGAGKTYVMIAAGQELRRMGLSKKNLYVMPNNLLDQWKSVFLSLYPDARLLCLESKNFTPDKREAALAQIRDGDFDGILMTYSCFERIPLPMPQGNPSGGGQASGRQSSGGRTPGKRAAKSRTVTGITFDQLGINRLFVDEAHNYKNVPVNTKVVSVLGVNTNGSAKAQDMLNKVHCVQKQNNGKGVVLATGTPLTNSITEVFVLQTYLQSGELAILGLQNFDSWIGMFAEKVTEFEIDVDAQNYRLATRFAKFHNLPELTALLGGIADFHPAKSDVGVPQTDGYTDALISKTSALSGYLNDLAKRADDIRGGLVSRKDDNMLKITTDGRKAALDLRLVEPSAGFTYQSKAARCAENVASIYFETAQSRSTQLIFCDSSTPKAGFNLYDELKRLLGRMGIPGNEIAFVHDADTQAKRERLFTQMRSGKIRILIGSTFKLGLGINVQDRLIALHHLDVPWRPADMTQREGRILRQGNQNPKVRIFRYITESSFDAYSWQLLESKQRFIAALLSGSLNQRSGSDIENTVLDYAEVKALAVGNPLIRERVETVNELTRFRMLRQKWLFTRMDMEKELLSLPSAMDSQRETIRRCASDCEAYAGWKRAHPPAEDAAGKKEEAAVRRTLREQIRQALEQNVLMNAESRLMDYRGFRLILPANMLAEKPFVWLEREGRYYVELGDTEIGNLIRIDNLLDTLPEQLDRLRAALDGLIAREKEIRVELARSESYSEQIEALETKLQSIDRKLGVNKK